MHVYRPRILYRLTSRRRISKGTKRTYTSSSQLPQALNPTIPIEEETLPSYEPTSYYPVTPGHVFQNRYKTLTKVGWGTCSTVWLARDLNRHQPEDPYVVLKVCNNDYCDKESAEHELRISEHIAAGDPSHDGFPLVRTAISSFDVEGPDGTHVVLVYEPMRESLQGFRRRFSGNRIPLPLIKAYLKIILMALDYLHSECKVIHTDIKLDNILLGFEDPSVIEDFVQGQAGHHMARKIVNGRTIYKSHNDFGALRSLYMRPQIADFGLAQRGDCTQFHGHPIQPDHYRAPEVLLGIGWTYSADIWNLGVFIWNLLENRNLFTTIHSAEGQYNSHAHIAEMIALIGPPPDELIVRERESRSWRWEPAVENLDGQLCNNASAFYGGPFFDSRGGFIRNDLVPYNLNLANSITLLQGDEKNLFLAFVRKMLQWLPERKTAKELLEDPWLAV